MLSPFAKRVTKENTGTSKQEFLFTIHNVETEIKAQTEKTSVVQTLLKSFVGSRVAD